MRNINMMQNIKELAIAFFVTLLFTPLAFSSQQHAVAHLVEVEGEAFVESPDGRRIMANRGLKISEASTIFVLEKAQVVVNYINSECEIILEQNSSLTVFENEPCAQDQRIVLCRVCGVENSYEAGEALPLPTDTTASVPLSPGPSSVSTKTLGTIFAGALALGVIIEATDDDDHDDRPVSY